MAKLTHLLDTSVYSQRLRKHPHAGTVSRWSVLGDSALAISTLCEAELLFGLEKRGSTRLWTEYEQFLKNKLVVLPPDRKVIEIYAKIKASTLSKGIRLGEFELLIAATALAHDLKLATLNAKDFFDIPGLFIEDWS